MYVGPLLSSIKSLSTGKPIRPSTLYALFCFFYRLSASTQSTIVTEEYTQAYTKVYTQTYTQAYTSMAVEWLTTANNSEWLNETQRIEVPVCPTSVYGYGTAAVVIVSTPPFAAILMARFSKSPVYKYVITSMLGLGVGSLIGDAFLHLMPEVFDVKAEEGDPKIPVYFFKLVCTCAAVWAYFVLQLTIQSVLLHKEAIQKSKVTSETIHEIHSNKDFQQISLENVEANRKSNVASDNSSNTSFQLSGVESNVSNDDLVSGKEAHKNEGLAAVGWMVTIGDLMHNFTDGLAIGAAFCKGSKLGISTTIAIFVHEIPQEFGDTALMLASGWSWRRALLLNLIAQMSAVVGVYIGIGVSHASQEATSWILAVTAGSFVYLALTDAVPEILELCAKTRNFVICVCPNVGIITGYVIMIVIAIYEDDLIIN